MSDDGRKDDVIIERLDQMFTDYVKYDRERWDNFEKKYEKDWQHTQEWRTAHWVKIEELKTHLDEILPNYRRGMWIFWLSVSGSVGLLLKKAWDHVAIK